MTLVDPSDTIPLSNGESRIIVVGTSGSGKTTLARELSQRLGVTHVEFDAYRHGPNWTETPDELFRENLAEALAGNKWVADGNYSVARDVVWPRANTLVWLDYPFRVIIWRLWWRVLRRGITREELWNGNREALWMHFFTRESLFLWAFNTHWKRRETFPAEFTRPEYTHLEVLRFRSPGATRKWLDRVAVHR